MAFFLKTLLLESSHCIRISDLFTGHAVLPIKEKVHLLSFLAVEKFFKMHLRPMKAENLKGKYKKFPHLPFFFNLMRFQSLPPFQEDLVWGIWNLKASNSSSEMSGWSKRRGGHQIKLSSPLIVNINQRNFRESREKSTSLCCKVPGVIWLLRLLEMRSSHSYPKWKTKETLPQIKLLLGEWT